MGLALAGDPVAAFQFCAHEQLPVPDTDRTQYLTQPRRPPNPVAWSGARRRSTVETTRRLIDEARRLANSTPSEYSRQTDALAEMLGIEFCAGRECALRAALVALGAPPIESQIDQVSGDLAQPVGILADLDRGAAWGVNSQTPESTETSNDRKALDLLLSVADDFACRAQCPSCQPDERRRPMRSVYAFPIAIAGPFNYRLHDEARLELTQLLSNEPFGMQTATLVLPGLVPARTLSGLRWLPMQHLIQAVADGVNVLDRIAGTGSESSPEAGRWQLRFLLLVLDQPAENPRPPADEPTLEQLRTRLEPILRRHLRVPVELLDVPRIAFVSLQSGVISWLVRNLAERRDRLVAAGRNANQLQARTSRTLTSRGGLRVEILDDDGITLADTEFPTDGIEQPQELIALMGSGLRSLGFRLAPSGPTL
ncbi:MAG: hypothetical protein EBT08_05045 [Betaproteobacteria bacterium]|nr:hypothetical protein [Betaproteobacteria bacterium]